MFQYPTILLFMKKTNMPILICTLFFWFAANTATYGQSAWKGQSVDFSNGKLIVSSNQRFIIHENGTPFFYFGDTAWELFHRLNAEEVENYLENRRAKGFTVIQCVILAELDGLNEASKTGFKPLKENDPTQPNEDYFQWVDQVMKRAASKGLYMGILPTWGDKIDKKWGVGPVIFNTENAFQYGKWLGERYCNVPNIIWINGGDRPGGNENTAIWNALAEGIKSVDKNHLMTYHPGGETSSSFWFQDQGWLDFNMSQTGHGQRSYDIINKLIVGDYNLTPTKPCINGEPCYEDHPVSWLPEIMGWFDEADVRKAMYWSLFSGAFGHTYGCHPIWQFHSSDHAPVGFVRHQWQEVLDLPGASDIIHARRLLSRYDYLSRVPAPEIVLSPQRFATDKAVATKGNGYALVYLPEGHVTEVSLEQVDGAKKLRLSWYDVRTGETNFIQNMPAKGTYTASPQQSGRGFDWVLIIEKTDEI